MCADVALDSRQNNSKNNIGSYQLADLSKIASDIKIENDKITFVLDKNINSFGIRYQGEEKGVEGKGETFSALESSKKPLVRYNERGELCTLISEKSERYDYKITKLEDGKSKFELTLKPELTKAYLDIGNSTVVVDVKNGSIVKPKEDKIIDPVVTPPNVSPSSLPPLKIAPKEIPSEDVRSTKDQDLKKNTPPTDVPSNVDSPSRNNKLTSNQDLSQLSLPPKNNLSTDNKEKKLGETNLGSLVYGAASLSPRIIQSTEQKLNSHKSFIQNISKNYRTEEELVTRLKEIRNVESKFDKSFKKDLSKLESQIKNLDPESDKYKTALKNLNQYKDIKSELSLKKEQIASILSESSNEKLSSIGNKSLIKLNKEVLNATDEKNKLTNDPQKKLELEKFRDEFKLKVKEAVADSGSIFNKIKSSTSDYLESHPTVKKVVDGTSKLLTGQAEIISKRAESILIKKEIENLSKSQIEKLETTLDKKINSLKNREVLGEDLSERIKNLEDAKVKVVSKKVEKFPETELETKSQTKEFNSIDKKVKALERAVGQDPNSEILKSELELTKVRKDLLLESNKLELLEKTKNTDPKLLIESKDKIKVLQNTEYESISKHHEALTTKIDSSDISTNDKKNLILQRESLERSMTDVQIKDLKGELDNKTFKSTEKIKELYDDLKESKEKLLSEKDPTAKKDLENKISDLDNKKNRYERLKLDQEINSFTDQKKMLSQKIGQINDELKNPNISEIESKAKKAHLVKLEKELVNNKENISYLTEKKEIFQNKIDLNRELSTLDDLKKTLEITNDQALRAKLEAEIKVKRLEATDLATKVLRQENTFKKVWGERLSNAVKTFNKTIPGSEWAKKNPVKAGAIIGMVSEAAFAVSRADYSPESRHSLVPSLVSLLNNDIRDWASFTTDQAGVNGSIAIEATSAAGNVLLAVGAFKGVEVAATRFGLTKFVPAFLAAGPAQAGTVGVFSFIHGYSNFSGGEFVNYSDRELAADTGSPIVAGGIGGATVGSVVPGLGTVIGAGIGAGAGAVGEVVGVVKGLNKLDEMSKSETQQKAVIESLRLAEMGFVYKEGDNPNRSKLTKEEEEVIDEKVKIASLGQIYSGKFSEEEIKKLGLKTRSEIESATESDKNKFKSENEDRINELYKRGLGWFTGDQINNVKADSPKLGKKIENLFSETKNSYIKLYDSTMRVNYSLELPVSGVGVLLGYDASNMGRTTVTNRELDIKAKILSDTFSSMISNISEYNRSEIANKLLKDNFPELETILSTEEGREILINNLGSDTPLGKYVRELSDDLISTISKTPEGLLELVTN